MRTARLHEVSDPAPNRDNLQQLIRDLEALGVDVPRGAEFLARGPAIPAAPTAPPSLLDATDTDLANYARDVALYRLMGQAGTNAANEIARDLCIEYAGVIAAHADSIVDQLRGPFEAALDEARHLVALGVRPDDTPDTLIDRDPELIAAWRAFSRGPTPAKLDRIADARIDLSRICGVPPRRPPGPDWTSPRDVGLCFGGVTIDVPNHEDPWQRWVRLAAAHVGLPAPSTISELDELRQSRTFNPDLYAIVAASRHEQRTHTATEEEHR